MKLYAYIALAVLAAAAVWGIYHAGGASCRADVAERDNRALLAAQKQIAELTAKVAAQETQHAADMAAIEVQHDEELTNATNERDRALADVRSGKLRLRIAAACPSAGGSGAGGKTSSAAGESDQAGADRRAQQDATFLVQFASERDKIALERNECVEIATKDRSSSH